VIKEIYDLVPNIEVTFLKARGITHPEIASHFEVMEPFVDVEPFPNFHEHFHLLDKEELYDIAYAPKSGKAHEHWRQIPKEDIPENGTEVSPEKCPTLYAAFQTIIDSREFIGPQGLMVYFALSQQVPTTVYIGPQHEYDAFYRRVLPEWEEYIKEIRRV
jgi:hypothetical protein